MTINELTFFSIACICFVSAYNLYLRMKLEKEVERRIKLRSDLSMTLKEIDNEVNLDPADPDFSAGKAAGLRQAQRMFEAVLERDARREKRGN
jgi:hypothetical protein